MKIIITEEQLKKILIETKDYYDFWDDELSSVTNILSEFMNDKKNGIKTKKWRLIPFEQYRNALIEFMRYGKFMRFPTKYIDRWSEIVTNNILSINAITELAGHTQFAPYDEVDDFFFGNDPEKSGQIYDYESCYKYLDSLGFYDWANLPDETFAISDYGLKPLYKLIMELEEKTTPEEKLVVINKILDVTHMRGDLSSAFIEGGARSLSKISRTENEEVSESDLGEMAYPESFNMNTFKSIKSFKGRVDYCKMHLKRIGEGSSRMVFKIDDEKVLKLAKNRKGIGQNEVETDMGYNENYFTCIAKVFDYDENYLFVEMESAKKCSHNDFKRITGYDFNTHIKFLLAEENNELNKKFSQEFIDEAYENNSIMTEVIELLHNWDLPVGDYTRISSYGIVTRNGKEIVVVVDYGLNKEIQKTFYSPKKNLYSLYENNNNRTTF